MSQLHTLYTQDVLLDKVEHRYFNVHNGNEYVSFSKCFEFLSEKFDSEGISAAIARRDGVSAESVQGKWNSARDEGTRFDGAIKLYSQTGHILKENEDLADIVKLVSLKYKDYKRTFEDLVIFNHETRTAGEIDKLSIKSAFKTSNFHISDFKLFEAGMSYAPKGKAWLNYPFDYLPNTKYTKICFQLSFYAWHYEKLTGQKCERMFIDLIIPIKDSTGKVVEYKNEVIPANYMKSEVEIFINTFKSQILQIVEPIQLYEF